MTKAKKEWIETAVAALDKAYVPYSKFPVGACLVTKKGTIYQGINIENASFGLTNCGTHRIFQSNFRRRKRLSTLSCCWSYARAYLTLWRLSPSNG